MIDRSEDDVADPAYDSAARRQLLVQLSDQIGAPVVAVVSGWRQNRAVNLGEEGARAFLDILDAELAAVEAGGGDTSEPSLGLFLVGRGGFAGFADGVWRALQGRGVRATAIVPYRVDGVFTLLAIGAERCVMHPYGSLGAYDSQPLGTSGQGRLARQVMARMVGGTESGLGARVERDLSAEAIGAELALGCGELDQIGFDACLAAEPTERLIWTLYELFEQALGIRQPATPRYTESEVADEVEFELATGALGATIEGVHRQFIYELDTGSPDPDTGMLDGHWLPETPT